jgi:hypothetical protein
VGHIGGPSLFPLGRVFLGVVLNGVNWSEQMQASLGVGADSANLLHATLRAIGQGVQESVIADQQEWLRQDAAAREAAKKAAHASPGASATAPTENAAPHVSEAKEAPPAERGEEKSESDPPPPVVFDPELVQAAELLGVKPDATEDEIRAALRRHLATSGLHPDHGGDGEQAKRFIAAKNLMIDRARKARS